MEENKDQETMTENVTEKLTKLVEQELSAIAEEGIHSENVEYLYKLVDIHKDIENEEYWKIKKEVLKYDVR